MDQPIEGPTKWEQKVLEKVLLASVNEQKRARRWGIFFKVLIIAYIFLMTFMWFQGKPNKPGLKEHVALVEIMGGIGQGMDVDADQVATSLRRAFEEPKAKAVLLRINSPGGTPVQSAYLYDELRRLRGLHPDKKVYAVAMDMCASGAYYVAAGADQIYANASSIIGSIGVVMPAFGFVDVIKKIGVEQRSLTAGKDKLFLDPFSPENPTQVDHARSMLSSIHDQFIKAVKEGRGDRLKEQEELFTGLFWTGEKALELGLVDGLGSAAFVAREVIGIEDIIDYTISNNLLDRLASRFGASMSKQISSELGLKTLNSSLR